MTNLNSSGLMAQLAYKAYLTEINERLIMNATSETITTDTKNQKVQDEEGNFPEEWMQALAFAEFVHRRLIWLPSQDVTACMNLMASIINATNRPSE